MQPWIGVRLSRFLRQLHPRHKCLAADHGGQQNKPQCAKRPITGVWSHHPFSHHVPYEDRGERSDPTVDWPHRRIIPSERLPVVYADDHNRVNGVKQKNQSEISEYLQVRYSLIHISPSVQIKEIGLQRDLGLAGTSVGAQYTVQQRTEEERQIWRFAWMRVRGNYTIGWEHPLSLPLSQQNLHLV